MQKVTFQHTAKLLAIVFFCLSTSFAFSQLQEDKKASEQSTTQLVADTDLEIIRKRFVSDLLTPSVDVEQIKLLMKTIKPDGSWPNIDYIDTSRTGFQHREHLQNMLELSRAYKKAGTEFYKNAEVKKTVSSALDFWISTRFYLSKLVVE